VHPRVAVIDAQDDRRDVHPRQDGIGYVIAQQRAKLFENQTLQTFVPVTGTFFSSHDKRLRENTTLIVNVVLGACLALGGGALRAPWSASPVLVIAATVIVLDFATYLGHRIMHHVPALWRAHRVHHADPLVDVTTTLRQHPIESLVRVVFLLVPVMALGLPAYAVAVYRALSALHALFEHTNVKLWPPLDRALSFLICTPNMHKLHHSREARETDTNYGNIFSVFDRLLGTFTPSSRVDRVEYGLDGYDAPRDQSYFSLLRLPFHDAQRDQASDP
jgi:sterol desaturase/sphingolipid hydroxylase (fatty acid hydroxylase superfamily)